MQNLAGVPYANAVITAELAVAEVPIRINRERLRGEVSTHYEGKLGPFTFGRAWYYWVAEGPVPIEIAREIYKISQEAALKIRSGGHCGDPSPDEYGATPLYDDNDADVIIPMIHEGRSQEADKWIEEKYKGKPLYVTTYHIDTQEGLNWFVGIIKKHNLDKVETETK